jgi:nitrite reductase/ring-hydroxylating ferredoxin subunit
VKERAIPSDPPAPESTGLRLCRIEEIPEGTARGFLIGEGPGRLDFFVYRRGDLLLGYRNACPHQGTPLELFPDRFLTSDRQRFLCTTHGAQFRIEDGYCLKGPCKGKSLSPFAVETEAGWLLLPASESR